MKQLLFIFLIILASMINSQNVFSYDDQTTHPDITKIAVQKSILKTYLNAHLGAEFSQEYDSLIVTIQLPLDLKSISD